MYKSQTDLPKPTFSPLQMDQKAQPCQNPTKDESQSLSKTTRLFKNDLKWDSHKDEIYRFYIQEDNALLETKQRFEKIYGLKARLVTLPNFIFLQKF
jgi:hypothetical protein